MHLRTLKPEDAPLMLEWMHDENCVGKLQSNFMRKTLADCQGFIASSTRDGENIHLAIADDADTYMGTVSLKHIDRTRLQAEFAIAMRACAMGTGLARSGMTRILELGLQELGLREIYWCVSPENTRAVRFYDKNGYPRVSADTVPTAHYTPDQAAAYIWYAVRK